MSTDTDPKKIGKRLRFLREQTGLARKEFGMLFHSKEGTVCEWEYGRCVPRLSKLLSIAMYFGVSLDCIISGKASIEGELEDRLSRTHETDQHGFAHSYYAGRFVVQFNSLPNHDKERLIGYLDALSRKA